MNNLVIGNILSKSLGGIFKGVFSFEEWRLVPKVSYPCAFVFNTEPSHHKFGHWIAIYVQQNGQAIFFDSFGRSPTELGFDEFLKRHSKSWKYNNVLLQNPMSIVCGQHVVVFLITVATKGKTAWINKFSSDWLSNDWIVFHIVNRSFHVNCSFYPISDFIM